MARYGYSTYYWYHANYCDEERNIGTCKYSKIMRDSVGAAYNETIHLSKDFNNISNLIQQSLKNCSIKRKNLFIFNKNLSVDTKKKIRILNYENNKLTNYVGINLNDLKCKRFNKKFKIEIQNNNIFAHGYYEPFINFDGNLYSVSQNYAYDELHYKKKVFL